MPPPWLQPSTSPASPSPRLQPSTSPASRACPDSPPAVECCHIWIQVADIIVVNAPGFLTKLWGLISRLTPAWWGLRLLDANGLAKIERDEGLQLIE